MASIPYAWSRRQLILLSTMRISLVPLLLLCCAPRSNPVIAGESPAFIFTAALGITNGLAGSLPMMYAPSKVPATLKEATGNMMTLSYNIGLTAGSLIGYVFDNMLGPQIVKPCPTFPYIATEAPMNITTTTIKTILTTLKTTTLAPITRPTTTTTLATTTLATTILPTTRNLTRSTLTTVAVTTLATVVSSLTSVANSMGGIEEITSTTTSPLASALTTVISAATLNNTVTLSLPHT